MRKLARGSYVMTGAHLIEIPKTQVHGVRIKDNYVEVTYTDNKGHSWFEKYDEKRLENFFKETIGGRA
jgi:hypothetical protein